PEKKRERLAAATGEGEAALREILKAQQVDRFRQIARQVNAPMSFSDPDVVAALALTPDQRAAIRKVQDRFWESRLRRGGPGGPPLGPPPGPPPGGPGGGPGGGLGPWDESQADANRVKQEAVEEILDELTPAQASTWKALT